MKKGFTLIELLAVIVIIAIIAIIAIPQITKLVADVREKADIESVRGYVDAANTYYMKAQMNDSMYQTLGSNVIDKLSIKGERLNGSVVVTEEGKVELVIVKNNKCYMKSALNNDIGVYEKGSCSNDISKYVSNNGQLHVCGRYLCNSKDDRFVIRGASTSGIGTKNDYDNPIRGEINTNSLATLKSWGGNALRIMITVNVPTVATYIGHEEKYLEGIKKLVNDAIKSDLYVILNWDPGRNDGEPFSDKAVEFFTEIANTYPNDPHIIYEIWNEPEGTNTMSDIKAHADKVIPVIRSISPNALVLCGTPDWNLSMGEGIYHQLSYENIMYVHHMYMSPHLINDPELFNKYQKLLDAGIPFFETEWGTMGHDDNDPMVMEPYATTYLNFLDKNNISWMMYGFNTSTDYKDAKYGIVLRGKWKDSLPESILKPNGIFMKNALMKNKNYYKNKSVNLLAENRESVASGKATTYRSDEWREKITSIEFKDELKVPNDAVVKWDLSLIQDKSIIGYLLPTSETDRYKMVIAANGYINAPKRSTNLFNGLPNLKSIDFNNFTTYYVEEISGMFNGDSSLTNLDLSGFDTSSIRYMWNTFSNCSQLESINFKNWNVKLKNWSWTFSNCKKLKSIDLSGFDVSDVNTYDGTFANCFALKSVNLSNFNPKSVTLTAKMFKNSSNISNIDISNMTITSTTDVTEMLYGIKENATVTVKDQIAKDTLAPATDKTINIDIKK